MKRVVVAAIPLTCGIVIFSAGNACAQTGTTKIQNFDIQGIIPQSIKDFAQKVQNTTIDLNQLPKLKSAVENIKGVVGSPTEIIQNPGGAWDRINNWMHAQVGFDLRQIAKAIGNVFLCILDILKEIITWAVSKL